MKQKFLKLLILAVAAYAGAGCVEAQTCKIRRSVSSSGGCVEYKEVYEYDYVWEKPSFPGGDCKLLKFINENRNYPRAAYKAGIEGRVVCSFIVNCDGAISDIQVFKGVEPSLNAEARRIFSLMPNWIPGKLDGVAVPVRVLRAVPFRK